MEGEVVDDRNGNGIRDADEGSLSDVAVQLIHDGMVCQETVTHSPYRFTGVAPGSYVVAVGDAPSRPGSARRLTVNVLATDVSVSVPAVLATAVPVAELLAASAPAAGGGVLAYTGSSSWVLVLLGIALLALGLGVVLTARNRRPGRF